MRAGRLPGATFALFGYTAAYEPSQRAAPSAALIVAASVAAWFAGARAIRDPDPGPRLLAIAGSLLVAPFVLFALAPGFGPPHDQPVEQNALRFLLLAIDSILVGIGLCALREALLIAGERVQSTLDRRSSWSRRRCTCCSA